MGHIEVGGLRVAYERVGQGPPLVLLHGAAEDGRVWRQQTTGLAGELTVVAWDEPGAGGSSDLPEGFSLAGYADALAALLEALDLGPAHVAGVSWGGTVALELYRRRAELVATLILIDTYAGWKGSLPADEVRARVTGVHRMLAAPAAEPAPVLPGLFAVGPPPELIPLLVDVAAGVRPATLAQQVDIMARTDLTALLPHVAVPTLLVWGRLDARSPLAVAHRFAAAIPDTTLVVVEGAGHLSHLERAEQVNDAIRDFCRAHPPAAG
ncbi:alpha/beta fold hydrolase [Promicromonospora sp. NPDC052451]|uniref:alpha/beta fold hydrolase n=1 Tax=Promicromonospora sp. NPDC052451 TaxID=3364407 RepID=UPI0037CBD226